jgi:AcrR family transcriptional regulator
MTTVPARTRLTREQSRQRTREALISAAMQVFARDGYAGASVDAIAAQAGFTVGALYSNFATKQELFLAVFEQHCTGELAALRALAAQAARAGELLAAVTARFADLDDQQRQWWQLSAELWLYAQRHPEAAARLAAIQAETRQVIAQALSSGDHPLSDELAAVIHALWSGFMHYRLTSPEAVSADAFGRAVGWLLAGQQHDTKKGPTP